jgi:hypothetical protein
LIFYAKDDLNVVFGVFFYVGDTMKKKTIITKDNYKEIILKRAIIICWVLLVICFIVKICGGNFFAIVCKNGKFVNFCCKIDNSFIKYFIYYITFLYTSILLLIITKPTIKLRSKRMLFYIITITIFWVFKLLKDIFNFQINLFLYNVFICIIMYLVLLVFNKKPLGSIIVIAYDFLLSLLSAIIKNIGLSNTITDSFLIDSIFLIDYYLLLTITMLYRKKLYLKEK